MKRFGFFVCYLVTFFGVLLSTPAPSHAQGIAGFTNNPYIQRGLNFYNDQKYPLAIKMFLQATKWPRSSKTERITALQYLGFTYVILGDGTKAEKYFIDLLSLDSKFRLTDATIPPKFVRFFNGVVKVFNSRRDVKIVSLTPEEVPTNKPLVIRLRVIDHLRRAKRFKIFYRLENSPRYFQRQLTETQPPTPTSPPSVAQPAPARIAPVVQPAPRIRTTPPPAVRTPAVRVPPVRTPAVQVPPVRVPVVRTPPVRTPDVRAPAVRAPDVRTPDVRAPAVRAPDVRVPAVRVPTDAGKTATDAGKTATDAGKAAATTAADKAAKSAKDAGKAAVRKAATAVRKVPADTKKAADRLEQPKDRVKGTGPKAERFYSHTVSNLLFSSLETAQAYYFEFYVVGYDSNNKPVAKLGSANSPVRVKRIYVKKDKPVGPVKPAAPFYKTWWFWTITGVVVAGGVTAIVVPLVCCKPPAQPTTGEVIITVIK